MVSDGEISAASAMLDWNGSVIDGDSLLLRENNKMKYRELLTGSQIQNFGFTGLGEEEADGQTKYTIPYSIDSVYGIDYVSLIEMKAADTISMNYVQFDRGLSKMFYVKRGKQKLLFDFGNTETAGIS